MHGTGRFKNSLVHKKKFSIEDFFSNPSVFNDFSHTI